MAGAGPIKTSRSSRWRAAVLIGIHVLFIGHLVHWRLSESTVAPLEPSEAMAFSKEGLINAGFVLFAIAILSTLIFGRFFCGWGCHVVALQDLSRWLLHRVGIRPKPLRSRVLMLVPLVAFVYMFLCPLIYRVLKDHHVTGGTALTTTQFWATFPQWFIALLTFFACGFVIVYMLGAKGFCTYACPYGGIFGVVEQLAPWRIRVTDACEGCGHCTAVCTSNVRVHQEVREHGMVVDPGCMKCLDCVSVCPNEALYVGFGRPTVGVSAAASARSSWGQRIVSGAVTAAFLLAALAVFNWNDLSVAWLRDNIGFVCGLAGGSWLLIMLLPSKSGRSRADYTVTEEILIGTLFLAGVVAFRGTYVVVPGGLDMGLAGEIPFLCALGLAAIAAYLGINGLRLLYKRNLTLHRLTVKRAGRVTLGGWIFAVFMVAGTVMSVHAASVQVHVHAMRRASGALQHMQAMWFNPNRELLSADHKEAIAGGLTHARALPRWARVGHPERERMAAWYELMSGNGSAFETRVHGLLELRPGAALLRRELAEYLVAEGRYDEAVAQFECLMDGQPTVESYLRFIELLAGLGRFEHAVHVGETGIVQHPGNASLEYSAALAAQMAGDVERALSGYQEAIRLQPDSIEARENYAGALCEARRFDACIAEFAALLEAHGDDAASHFKKAIAHLNVQQYAEAETHFARASALAPEDPRPYMALADLARLRGDELQAAEYMLQAKRILELEQAEQPSQAFDRTSGGN